MTHERQSKYFWPASAISESDMELLYLARQASPGRTPITHLIARAVRETYGHLATAEPAQDTGQRRAAA